MPSCKQSLCSTLGRGTVHGGSPNETGAGGSSRGEGWGGGWAGQAKSVRLAESQQSVTDCGRTCCSGARQRGAKSSNLMALGWATCGPQGHSRVDAKRFFSAYHRCHRHCREHFSQKQWNFQQEGKATSQWAFGVLVHKNGTKQGVQIDRLTPTHCAKERLRPQLNVQSVVGDLTLLLWFWRRGITLSMRRQITHRQMVNNYEGGEEASLVAPTIMLHGKLMPKCAYSQRLCVHLFFGSGLGAILAHFQSRGTAP